MIDLIIIQDMGGFSMSINKHISVVLGMVMALHVLIMPNLFAQKQAQQAQPAQAAAQQAGGLPAVNRLYERVLEVEDAGNEAILRTNESIGLAHHAMRVSNDALEQAERALAQVRQAADGIGQAQNFQEQIAQITQASIANLENEYNRMRGGLNDVERDRKIRAKAAKIQEMHRLGIFEQEERIRAQAAVDIETVKWNNIRKMLADPECIIKAVLAITAIAGGIYLAKYGIPALMNYMTQPQVVSETSKTGWFGWGSTQQEANMSDLIFTPDLNNQLIDLVLRIQSAKIYNENLPNILFHGAPGTGKTAFARALAYHSGFDYVLTSGSEFAKITDLNTANNELRKLLDWAQSDDKGLVIFIDEAESLFANRKLVTTSKITQDFINTFLALVPEKSQKNIMFVFATNHPFKLDNAITDRIGITIEFTIPQAPEREKILATYLAKFAQENTDALVTLHPDILEELESYAAELEGLCPRAIKFVAEEMVINARRQESKELTSHIAHIALHDAKQHLQQTAQWERERNEWINGLTN